MRATKLTIFEKILERVPISFPLLTSLAVNPEKIAKINDNIPIAIVTINYI